MLADSDRLLNTVEQVLQASRTREKNRLLNISEIELGKLLRESSDIIKTRYNLDDDAIVLHEKGEEIRVSGEMSELQTVFLNLIDNAVKYSGEAINVSIRLRNPSEKTAEIRIKDSGIGLDQTDLKRIFKRFYRVPNDATQDIKGSGLGLYIVRSIIKKHGGKIYAESRGAGRGTTFVVRLPKL